MRESYAKVSQLVPSQFSVQSASLRDVLTPIFSAHKFAPVPVVERDGLFFLGGGHNRAFIMDLANRHYIVDLDVPIAVAENYIDIGQLFEEGYRVADIPSFFSSRGRCASMLLKDRAFPRKVGEMFIDLETVGRERRLILTKSKQLSIRGNEVYVDGESIGRMPSLEDLQRLALRA